MRRQMQWAASLGNGVQLVQGQASQLHLPTRRPWCGLAVRKGKRLKAGSLGGLHEVQWREWAADEGDVACQEVETDDVWWKHERSASSSSLQMNVMLTELLSC